MTDDFDLTAWNNGEREHEQWHADCKPAADGARVGLHDRRFQRRFPLSAKCCARIRATQSRTIRRYTCPDHSSRIGKQGRCHSLQNLLQTLT